MGSLCKFKVLSICSFFASSDHVPSQSPAAFYVYSTVKVITAQAVTDDGGNFPCGTSSGIFRNINSNAEAYFGGVGIATFTEEAVATSVVTETNTYTFLEESTKTTETHTDVYTSKSFESFYVDGDGHR